MPKLQQSSKGGFEIVPSAPSPTSTSLPPGTDSERPKKRQKKQKKGVNSLSNARTNSSKADSKAEDLWFRKAGFGPVLFRQYYKAQPPGVVCRAAAPLPTPSSSSSSAEPAPADYSGLSKGQIKKLKAKARKARAADSVAAPAHPFEEFMSALSRPLPIAFRVRSHLSPDAISALQTRLARLPDVSATDFHPLVFQTSPSLHKKSISKFGEHHEAMCIQLMTAGSGDGTIARQEIVSMVPVLALGASPDDSVLDLCASPGSKTMQMMEQLSGSRGVIVANDIHPQRVAALKDAIGRASLPKHVVNRLLLSTHDGSKYPLPLTADLLFDKVMTDVPCSGDGTIRKDSSILPRWNPGISNRLHPLQVSIGWRGLELTRTGGIMCYSTCSFNPAENESVLAELLRRAAADTGDPNGVELVEWQEDMLPGLVRRPGVSDWTVADYVEGGGGGGGDGGEGGKGGEGEEEGGEGEVRVRQWKSFEEARAGGMGEAAVESLWPRADVAGMRMELANRFVPQDEQDAGGFFVALIRKNKPFRSELRMGEGGGKGAGGGAGDELEEEEVYKMVRARRAPT